METKFVFVWVDDNPDRQKSAENLADRIGVQVDFIGVDKKDIDEVLKELISRDTEPDLILMDHSLIRTESETFKTGSTAALFIHEKWHECPIICVTGAEPEDVDFRQRSAYEKIIPFTRISDYDSDLLSIAVGFRDLKNNRPTNPIALMDLMATPEDDRPKMLKILPKELKENFTDKSVLLEIFRWISTVLFERPGFLYDKLWAATTLGIKENSFHLIENIFVNAEYQGVFADDTQKLWWKSELLTILSEQVSGVDLPRNKGRKLPLIEAKDYSQCFASEEDSPEIVAFEDDTENAGRAPMKLKYTIAHPHYENLLFFEEIRIMKA